ncbi:MAG: VPLPA-CTERM-specific exosortase XrtD [Acidobacteriaceae bacterium]
MPVIAALAVTAWIFRYGLKDMIHHWNVWRAYSYGYLIPVITIYLIWQRRSDLARIRFEASRWGLAVIVLGLGLYLLGTLATVYPVVQYGLVVVLMGLALSVMGWQAFKLIWVPLFFLFFMIPLPGVVYAGLSTELQLLSSKFGVWIIQHLGVAVYLSGNVIDLGIYKLQVAQACSGLRYLFPLMSLAFIAACVFKGSFWKKAVIFLSSIPITVFMNSFRIGVIGVLVDYWGIDQAQGFRHFFEGWLIFMICIALIIGEMAVLSRIGPSGRGGLAETFSLDGGERRPDNAIVQPRVVTRWYIPVLVLLAGGALASVMLGQRQNIMPKRSTFAEFPLAIGHWEGVASRIQAVYLDQLKLSDYILADYSVHGMDPVNFYVSYYQTQEAGDAAHTPRTCIPGGGWDIKKLTRVEVPGVKIYGTQLWVNRVLIKKGNTTQVVYYWFQEQGRLLTNEYAVKWYLLWDGLTRQRTDGALVRLTAFVPPGGQIKSADQALRSFAKEVAPILPQYVPR